MGLQFAPKAGTVVAPVASQPAKGLPPHKPVRIPRIANYLGIPVRQMHGYIHRGKLKAFYIKDDRTHRYVYADEAVAIVRRASLKTGGSSHAIHEGTLLSWNKGDGRREVGVVGKSSPSGLTSVETSHKSFEALCTGLEEQVLKRKVVLEHPAGIVRLVRDYLRLQNPEHAAVAHLSQALEAIAK
jgi:hypothetical protein